MRRILLIDTHAIQPGLEVGSGEVRLFGDYVAVVLDLYARYTPQELGFIRARPPRSQFETLAHEWEQEVTKNAWVASEYCTLDIGYTLALQVYQRETLQNAHEPAFATPPTRLAKPNFPYDTLIPPAAITWEVLLYTDQAVPAMLTSIPGVRPLLSSVTSSKTTLRLVPRLRLDSQINFSAGASVLTRVGLLNLAARAQHLPGHNVRTQTGLF